MSDADAVARSAARDFPTPAKEFSDNAARHRDVASRADDTAAASWPEGIPDAARIAASCASLLDVLRGWRRARRAEYPIGEESRATRASESRDDADDASSRAGTALAATYEAANAAGLDRYCAHLLADVVTACGADGVGAAAERAMRPGTFALLDACGDRELQQLHAAFGSQSGGARRVTLAALVEEHRRSHKYDGKV